MRNRSLGFRRIPSNNWAFSGLRLEFTTQETPRSNKDSVTSGKFTHKHVADDIHINARRTNVCVSVEKPKTVEIWLASVKPSRAKPYLHFLSRFCKYAQIDPDSLVKNAKSDSEAVHNRLKVYRRSLESQGIASYTLQLAYNAVRSFLSWNNLKLSKTPKAFIGRTRYESDRVLEPHEVARICREDR